MDDRIKDIIESGLMESYLLGQCSPQEEEEIDAILENSEALRNYLSELEDLQFAMTEKMAVQPPSELKQAIKSEIETISESSYLPPKDRPVAMASRLPQILLLAALLLSIFLMLNLYIKNMELSRDVQRAEILSMQHQDHSEELNGMIDTLQEQLNLLINSGTEKHRLEALTNNGTFKAFAYWNEAENKSLLMLEALPLLPEGQCLQMWADVEGEMKSLGVLSKSTGLMAVPFLANAESLNVTIEPSGGSDHPNVDMLLASVAI